MTNSEGRAAPSNVRGRLRLAGPAIPHVLRLVLLGSTGLVKVRFGSSVLDAALEWGSASALLTLVYLGQLGLPPALLPVLSLASLAILCIHLLEVISFYLQGVSFSLGFFYHLDPNTLQYLGVYKPLVVTFGVVVTLALANELALWWCVRRRRAADETGRRRLAIGACVALAATSPWSAEGVFTSGVLTRWGLVRETGELSDSDQRLLSEAQIDLARLLAPQVHSAAATTPRNLLIIYLESVEEQFFDEAAYPGLLPFLTGLRRTGVDFRNALQEPGTEFTVAGMFASQCGLPLTVLEATHANDTLGYQRTDLLECLGDILADVGYQQAFLQGGSLAFASTGRLFADHHYDVVLGLENLGRVQGEPPRGRWGYHDRQLFEAAHRVLRKLAKRPPFSVVLATMDTHHPGTPSPGCRPYPYRGDSLLQAMHCTDQLVQSLLERLSDDGLDDNLTIAVMSDHLSMHNRYQRAPERKLTLFLVDGTHQVAVNARASHFDLVPTLLPLLGVETEGYFPFGRNLLADAPPPPRASPALVTAIRRGLRGLAERRLGCGTRVTVDVARRLVTIGNQRLGVRDAEGHARWEPSQFFVAEARDDVIVGSELTSRDELSRELSARPDAHRLVVGPLAELGVAAVEDIAWGYHFGRFDDPHGSAGTLDPGNTAGFVIECQR